MNYQWVKLLRQGVEQRIHKYQPQAVFEPEAYTWRLQVEAKHPQIRAEAYRVLDKLSDVINMDQVFPGQRALYQKDFWKTFFIKVAERDVPNHRILCPNTAAAIDQIPGVINAFFSIMQPGTHIPMHRGPYAGILRYHMGVIIPNGDVAIKVNGQTLKWQEGESLFFDDSFAHEAWNHTDQIRVILFVDAIRPLPTSLALPNSFILNCFRWTKNYKTLYREVLENQLSV